MGEGRPSESSLSRWTYGRGQRTLTHHLNKDNTTNTDYSKASARNAESKSKIHLTVLSLDAETVFNIYNPFTCLSLAARLS